MNKQPVTFALFGNPVAQSMSPLMHGAAFLDMNLEAAYRAIRVDEAVEIPSKMKALNISGASITIPHKIEIMQYLDEVSESAARIGAVNTIKISKGRLLGDNTDWTGLVLALKEEMDIRGRRFAILGAGGAARAAVYGVMAEGGTAIIINRSEDKGKIMARDFGCDFCPVEGMGKIKGDCLINTTPVGMFPHIDASPVDPEMLRNFEWVMDTIYNPLETRLEKDALRVGSKTISGLSMFVYQGVAQIRIWTGLEPPIELMKKVVLEKLKNYENC